MGSYNIDSKNKVKRIPDRGYYDKATVYEILDGAFVGHVGFVIDGQPFVIPMAFGRKEDHIYLHGATSSRLMRQLSDGIPACLTVTHLDGIVLARSTFHSSMNYRSAVIFGQAKIVENERKIECLKIITDHILKGRWEETRPPHDKELKATTVLELTIKQASAKIRTGPPIDDKEDYDLD
ncbi:MAG: pyridoxamine 5'-phosphate oxidase family protein, partial [Bacteroidetes bacterium]|nr:pyridoxamine 5'-phosphate oxidase family protein [Bacteroidota bacterium]